MTDSNAGTVQAEAHGASGGSHGAHVAHGAHGDPAAHEAHVKKQIRTYMIVFAALAALTVVTVAVSYLHLSIVPALGVALFVAGIKGSLVACYFMHLIDERKAIYALLILTVFFFIVLIFLPLLGYWDPTQHDPQRI